MFILELILYFLKMFCSIVKLLFFENGFMIIRLNVFLYILKKFNIGDKSFCRIFRIFVFVKSLIVIISVKMLGNIFIEILSLFFIFFIKFLKIFIFFEVVNRIIMSKKEVIR